jgi:hypothetical protein
MGTAFSRRTGNKMMTDSLKDKVAGLTQRLDHMMPDPKLSKAENLAATRELKALTDALFELLPDKSLSPMERIERLARSVEPREPRLEELKPAATKLAELKARLNEIIPGDGSPHDKLLSLELALDESVGLDKANLPTFKKLELLGDPRGKVEPE